MRESKSPLIFNRRSIEEENHLLTEWQLFGVVMEKFIQIALSSISDAASGPYAFAAYAIAIAAYVICFYRISRNKALLEKIHQLPETDRLQALRNEMGGILLPSSITAEEWLKARRQRYLLVAFGVSLTLIISLAALVYFEMKGKVIATVDLHQEGSSWADITYSQKAEPSGLKITPNFPYLDEILSGRVLGAMNYYWLPFSSETLKLSFKIKNDSRNQVFINLVRIDVLEVDVDREPIPLLLDNNGEEVIFENFGWGNFLDPTIEAAVYDGYPDCDIKDLTLEPVKISEDLESVSFNVRDIEKDELFNDAYSCSPTAECISFNDECAYFTDVSKVKCSNLDKSNVCVPVMNEFVASLMKEEVEDSSSTGSDDVADVDVGDVKFFRSCGYERPFCLKGFFNYRTEENNKRSIPFAKLVDLNPPGVGAPAPPSYSYEVHLKTDSAPYSVEVPISQIISPNGFDNFTLSVIADKSARFQARIRLFETDGKELLDKAVDLRLQIIKGSGSYIEETAGSPL